MEPFSHQGVQYDMEYQESVKPYEGNVSVPICENWDLKFLQRSSWSQALKYYSSATTKTIYEGIFMEGPNTTMEAQCPTGNFTFGTYQSVEVCSRYEDITDFLLAYLGDPTVWGTYKDIPAEQCGGLLCSYGLPRYHLYLSGALPNSIVASMDNPILLHPKLANFTAIQANSLGKLYVLAIECTLSYCVKRHNGNVTAGKLVETASEVLATSTRTPTKLTLDPSYCQPGSFRDYSYQKPCQYLVPDLVSKAINIGLNNSIANADILQALYENDIGQVFSSIASLLTKRLRTDFCGGLCMALH